MNTRRDKLVGYSVVVVIAIVAAEVLRYMAFHGVSRTVVVAAAIAVVALMIGATVMVARH